MIDVSLILTIIGIFLQSVAVIFGLKRLFKPRYSQETSNQKYEREKNEDLLTLILVLGGMIMQVLALLLEFAF